MYGANAPFYVDIGGMRKEYKGKSEIFTEKDLKGKEPFGQFKEWFEEACNHPSILEANAVCLATATKKGIPSARQVLLKGYGTEGFRFFTNYNSRKSQELAENPHAALNFYWEALKKAVRVEGHVEKVSAAESDEYFHSRSIPSQIGAVVSEQSKPIASRDVLTKRNAELSEEYGDGSEQVPRPEHWGGFLVVPEVIEFWQGQTDRLHDRIRFRRQKNEDEPDGVLLHQGDNGWVYERLSP
ncbi:pyridoxine-5'-phosphate oxidase-like isoform X2 [Zootermopsis nevadensis]|nr:pyridoxine-5'-phosphate oxidase-like isoform X2 [Zootermopsis nevadensis]XP_021940562.1 pyridoxine-5'-phosphate oxidase-like isoform X2 [Zootermopsis nevadensis]XP_021940563.1 pyridoxine-5'-phosphate oxidase-like isoform X2 [Zootermopsis nevadensis]